MNRLILTVAAVATLTMPAWAAGKLTFADKNIDFGSVKADGGMVTMKYTYTNTGDAPVSIVTVTNGGCGCTRPEFTVEPVRPGEKGAITVHFNPSTFRGEVNRSIKVQTSDSRKREKLTFSGVVVPSKK